MKLYRITAVIKRHILQMQRDFGRIFDMVYWPLVDIVLWGFASVWLEHGNATIQSNFVLMMALIFWSVLWRSQIDVSLSFLEELWSANLVNLVATPLMLTEWMAGVMILGIIRSVCVFVYTSCMVWLLFGKNVLLLGSLLPLFIILAILSGWAIGFFVAGFLAYYGKRIQSFVWAIGWFFSILGAVFYPLSVLPAWFQAVCKLFPLAYMFEALRIYANTAVLSYWYIAIAFVLNVVYVLLAIGFFSYMFARSCRYGLARVESD